MNIFDKMKAEILKEHPKLSLIERVKTFWRTDVQQHTVTIENEKGTFSQSAILLNYKSKERLVRFGTLP